MLTRLKVQGFKNLQDIDVRFGPFTCIAGANGVGKSNLFDAIVFLSSLASRPLNEAAMEVRDSRSKTTDIRSLFFNCGESPERRMRFEAEMVVPQSAVDELGQQAQATNTFLRYALELAYIEDADHPQRTKLHLKQEELTHVKLASVKDHLWFPHDSNWRDSAIKGSRRGAPYISTLENEQIRLHQDGKSGQPRSFQANTLPRTVLSSVNAQESPTALLAKREMESWKLLQLEPSVLRSPDPYNSGRTKVSGTFSLTTLRRLSKLRQKQRQKGRKAERQKGRKAGRQETKVSRKQRCQARKQRCQEPLR